MKHLLIIVGAFILIFGIAIFNIRLFFGSEDTWLCQNGAWVMHGRPFAPAPISGCDSKMISQPAEDINPEPEQPGTISADQVRAEVKIDQPESNAIISSPVIIEGQAKGNWFFEASFPIKIIGEDGETIGQGIATAQSDWMTVGFVPFKASIEFNPGSSTIGMIVLRNDNPSGMPEKEKQYGIPVRFSKVEKITLKAYFGNTDLNPGAMDCSVVFPVERLVNKTQSTARAALEELLSGPTDAEKTQGYYTSLNPGVKINSLAITNGIAKVDFDEQMDFQMGGSCRVAAIRSQITQTLKQFSTVKEVIISVDGNSEEALQP